MENGTGSSLHPGIHVNAKRYVRGVATALLLWALLCPCALRAGQARRNLSRTSGPRASGREPQTARPSTYSYKLEEATDEVRIKTAGYEAALSREGFQLTLRRGGKVVFESARVGDADTSLSFMRDGARQHVAKLQTVVRGENGVRLDYATTNDRVRARVELSPSADALRVTTWLLPGDAEPVPPPSLRVRLASSGVWFGGGFQGFRNPQTFPLNRAHISNEAFLETGVTQATPAWYATGGAGLVVQTPHDFRYSINAPVASKDDGLLTIEMPGVSSLAYDIIVGADIREVVRKAIRMFGYPRTVPPADYFRLPIYTTWVEHKTAVSQEKVLEFARAIHDRRLPCGVIEIDDKWETRYGDMEFIAEKFPDPKRMVDELHRMGYRVTLWVHSFVEPESQTYRQHHADGLLMRDLNGNAGLSSWWNGTAAVWDYTNPAAAQLFRARLRSLQRRYGIDGFKFDGGDLHRVPRDMRAMMNINNAEYADIYNREAAAHFPWNETRVGIRSQPLGIVQRLHDINSTWGRENGLAAMIPAVNTVSLRGFQYVMPDIVGGNQYGDDRIEKELLIRWAQASALMPLLQFGLGSWHFDEETVSLVRAASEAHVRFAPCIYRLASEAPRTGEPIVAPLWYHAPTDARTYEVNDEYMLGPDILVAPVIERGAAKRDVYLPAGRWRDDKTGRVIEGARWVRDYPAPLDALPIFLRDGAQVGPCAAPERTDDRH